MKPTITFFSRSDKLYLRINLGESNKKYERSCDIDISGLKVRKHRSEGGYVCRVDGYSKPATKANAFIREWEDRFEDAATPEEAILLWEKGKDAARETRLLFGDLLNEYIRERGNEWSYSLLQNFLQVQRKYKDYCGGDDFNIYTVDVKSLEPHRRRPVIKEMKSHWKGFAQYLSEELDHSQGTIYLYFTKLSEAIRNADREYGIEIPFPYRPEQTDYEAQKVDWPDEVARAILSLPNEGFYTLFKAQIWTTLRISDLFSLSVENFEEISLEDCNFWRVVNVNQKTAAPVTPTLPEDVALSLLANIQKNGHVVPSGATCLTTYNRHLRNTVKELFPNLKIALVTGKGVADVPVWETATSHQLRAEGLNLYARGGFDADKIRRLFTGHKSEEVYRRHYEGALRVDALREFAEFQKRYSVDSEGDTKGS